MAKVNALMDRVKSTFRRTKPQDDLRKVTESSPCLPIYTFPNSSPIVAGSCNSYTIDNSFAHPSHHRTTTNTTSSSNEGNYHYHCNHNCNSANNSNSNTESKFPPRFRHFGSLSTNLPSYIRKTISQAEAFSKLLSSAKQKVTKKKTSTTTAADSKFLSVSFFFSFFLFISFCLFLSFFFFSHQTCTKVIKHNIK